MFGLFRNISNRASRCTNISPSRFNLRLDRNQIYVPHSPSVFHAPIPRSLAPNSSRYYTQRKRPRMHYRFDPNEARNAKPLITPETLQHGRWGIVILVGGGIGFYVINLEEVPVSGRRRFNFYSSEAMDREGRMMYRQIMREYESNILPDFDNRTIMVRRVMERLIPASGLTDCQWEVHVIDSKDKNAFVIPGGKVFVFTGILPIAQTDDGLAAILGHEIAHNVANHSGESMSRNAFFFLPLRWLFQVLDETGYTAGLGQILGPLLLNYGLNLPASRNQESEADYIGLMMMAQSCYDPKEAVGVWERMQAEDKSEIPQWLSTHPSHGNRIVRISDNLPKAETARDDSGCGFTSGNYNNFENAFGGLWGTSR